MTSKFLLGLLIGVFGMVGCGGPAPTAQALQVTLPPIDQNAPIYTDTPTVTPTFTLTPTSTLTATATATPTVTATFTVTRTPSPRPTQGLWTLTPPSAQGAPQDGTPLPAPLSATEGWSCIEFPCEDDIRGFLARIRVPEGYEVSHIGQFPAQPLQIAYGPDGRLYATAWIDGTQLGAIFVMDDQGRVERYHEKTFYSPVGLAFQPGTDVLYVSGRVTPEAGGGVWRITSEGRVESVIDDLPCCLDVIGNQPNGLIFGQDGYLYLGVGALTDRAEPADPRRQQFAELLPNEAAILRIQPHTGAVEVFANGIRNPYDLAIDATGRLYVTDNGILEGPGDRILQVRSGGHYGFPYWRNRGCVTCPLTNFSIDIQSDWLTLPNYTLPRGIVVYTGQQFPSSVFNQVFVAFWNGTPNSQRIVRIDPQTLPTDPEALAVYIPEPFMTGLIRPTDLTIAPDGSLVVADFIYGHVWQVRYIAGDDRIAPTPNNSLGFATATPRP
ncbi:MAG: PQQ-dependent sugar dehydrogenase [Anaerolineae bacterium]|jgi:hypothetical protein|nr:PQQ-dependent sugar dehydrogenase [Anaerolineae bacterium]